MIVKEERQYLAPKPILILRVLFPGNSPLVVAPLLLADSDIYGPKRFKVGNEMGASAATAGALNFSVFKLRAKLSVLPWVPHGVKVLDAVKKIGSGNSHKQFGELGQDAQRRANRRCAALSRSVQRLKGAGLSAGCAPSMGAM